MEEKKEEERLLFQKRKKWKTFSFENQERLKIQGN